MEFLYLSEEYESKGKDPYPARPVLPYLKSAQALYLDMLINRINWLQILIDENTARSKANEQLFTDTNQLRKDQISAIRDYNGARSYFPRILTREKARSLSERLARIEAVYPQSRSAGPYRGTYRRGTEIAVARDFGVKDPGDPRTGYGEASARQPFVLSAL